jgi:hypothetical protein
MMSVLNDELYNDECDENYNINNTNIFYNE